MVMMEQGLMITQRERVMSKWTVWVGGSEMSSNLLTRGQAVSIANDWFNRGYDDVVVEEVA
jgi:hypothetical protein